MGHYERVGPRAWVGWGEEPTLPPIVGVETTDYGWRGVTADGEIYEMRSETGAPPKIPESIMVTERATGDLLGRRDIDRKNVVDISQYLAYMANSANLHRANANEIALDSIDHAIAIIDTSRARFNRAMILLTLGRWQEGFAEFENCERAPPFQRPGTRALIEAGAVPWRGESLAGKRLLLVHDHGFGDTIMMLRYVPMLRETGADVLLQVPLELDRLAMQHAPLAANCIPVVDCDYFTTFLHVLRWLDVTPQSVPTGQYIHVERRLGPEWRERIPAVVHVDGTARPQILRESENPLFGGILRRFRDATGLPVLINTSFNVHEEPIVNTPAECAKALSDGRIDFVVTQQGLYVRTGGP